MIGFAEQVRSDGAVPTVIVLPGQRDLMGYRGDLMGYRDGIRVYDGLLSWLTEAGVTTVGLMDPLAREAEHRDIDDLFGDGRHDSSSGNAVVTRHLAQTLPALVGETCRE